MDKLNVCLINDSFPPVIDGVANAVVNYARILNGGLGAASVVTPYYPEADDSVFDFPVLRYPSLDLTKAVGYRAGMPFSPELIRRLELLRFDVIHSHCPIASTLLARALRDRIDAPIIFTYHTKFDIDIANAVKGKLLREEAARLLAQNIAGCDEVWAVSRGAGENLRALGYRGDYQVMPNGVDFPRGRVSRELIDRAVRDFDLPEELPVFLYVGRMMWYKGIRITLDALAKLRDAGQGFRMVFVGGGGDREEIMAYAASLGLEGLVLFSPPIRDRELIRAWYCRADLFLFPSTFDTNGLVVREAAACGLASVLVAGSCAAEDIGDGETGFLIEENAESMAQKLFQLCPRLDLAHQVGRRAQQEIYISWEEAVTRAYRRYGVVLENYRRGLYPEHDGMADALLHGLAGAMDALGKSRERGRQALDEVQSDYAEMKSELKAGLDQVQSEYEELKDELKAGLEEKTRRLKDRLEDIAHKIEGE